MSGGEDYFPFFRQILLLWFIATGASYAASIEVSTRRRLFVNAIQLLFGCSLLVWAQFEFSSPHSQGIFSFLALALAALPLLISDWSTHSPLRIEQVSALFHFGLRALFLVWSLWFASDATIVGLRTQVEGLSLIFAAAVFLLSQMRRNLVWSEINQVILSLFLIQLVFDRSSHLIWVVAVSVPVFFLGEALASLRISFGIRRLNQFASGGGFWVLAYSLILLQRPSFPGFGLAWLLLFALMGITSWGRDLPKEGANLKVNHKWKDLLGWGLQAFALGLSAWGLY